MSCYVMSYNILISTIFPTKRSMIDVSFDFHDYIILYYFTLYYIILHYVISCHVMLCHIIY